MHSHPLSGTPPTAYVLDRVAQGSAPRTSPPDWELVIDALPKIGRFMYAIPMGVFGMMHFMNAEMMAGMVPIPGGVFWVYVTGVALIAATISIISGKHAVLATQLLGLLLLSFALTIHLPTLLGGDQAGMSMLLKDLSLSGGAFVLSGVLGAASSSSA
jgi:putative oxidoreductase